MIAGDSSFCHGQHENKLIPEPFIEEKAKIEAEKEDSLDEVESRMSMALTEINNSFRCVANISKNALTELKALAKPPACVITTISGLVILFEDYLKKQNWETLFIRLKDPMTAVKK